MTCWQEDDDVVLEVATSTLRDETFSLGLLK
jgi:hypothetical protein